MSGSEEKGEGLKDVGDTDINGSEATVVARMKKDVDSRSCLVDQIGLG